MHSGEKRKSMQF